MAATELDEAKEILAAYKAAERAVLLGKEYTIGGRTVRRSDLAEIRAGRREWQTTVDGLSGGGGISLQYPDLAG